MERKVYLLTKIIYYGIMKKVNKMKFNKYNFMFKFIHILLIILLTFICCLIIFIGKGFIEKESVKNEISDFINRAMFVEEIVIQAQRVSIYKVIAEKDYEIENYKKVFEYGDTSKYYIGSTLDIILTDRNPLRNHGLAIVNDIGEFASTNFFIGHATINVNKDGSEMVESVGNDNGFIGVRRVENTWIETEVRYGNDASTIIGLRVKGIDEKKEQNIVKSLENKIGKGYNFNLLIKKKNKYYCTDLITRSFLENDIRIDDDYFYPIGNDIILSDNTFIIFLCQRIKEGYFNIYYLSEE